MWTVLKEIRLKKERGDGGGGREHKSEREEEVDRRVSRKDDSH